MHQVLQKLKTDRKTSTWPSSHPSSCSPGSLCNEPLLSPNVSPSSSCDAGNAEGDVGSGADGIDNLSVTAEAGRNIGGEGEDIVDEDIYYEAESPDEAALVHAARAYSFTLISRTPDQVTIKLPHGGLLSFELLHTLAFDSTRKRMSVIVKHPLTKEIVVYTKGADSVIMDLLEHVGKGK